MRKILWVFLKIAGTFVGCIITYFLAALLLSKVIVNSSFKQKDKDGIEIFVRTNGVHTDLVLPYKNELQDWSKFVQSKDTRSRDTTFQFVSFGWGDKGFYLETKTWDDLKFETAFNALFYRGGTAMHVIYHKRMAEDETCKRIKVSKENYKRLVEYIKASFELDNVGDTRLIRNAGYDDNDSFYEALGSYGLFRTCNTWTNNALKKSGLRACYWTPFDKGILKLYP